MRYSIFAIALVACAGNKMNQRGVADITPLKDGAARGQLVFTETGEGYKVEGTISGLAPSSLHGFHVHEVGDCSAPDGSSAKGHFNPQGEAHGATHDPGSHVGDLGNILSDAAGIAHISVVKEKGTIKKGKAAIAGRAVIVHSDADDLTSQPAGNAGSRIGCGVIKAQ